MSDAPFPTTEDLPPTTSRSAEINELAAALAKAQGAMGTVQKTMTARIKSKRTNTEYDYNYAPLDAVWEACREPLATNGLAVIQTFCGEHPLYILTMLLHSSGQWVESRLPLRPTGDTPQDLGSAITYARRYALQSLIGLAAAEDDDGKGASASSKKPPGRRTKPPTADGDGKTAPTPSAETATDSTGPSLAEIENIQTWETLTEVGRRLKEAKLAAPLKSKLNMAFRKRTAEILMTGAAGANTEEEFAGWENKYATAKGYVTAAQRTQLDSQFTGKRQELAAATDQPAEEPAATY